MSNQQASRTSNPAYVSDQYHDAANLNARIRLHARFSTNKYDWHRWVFDQLDLPARCRILELGCGPGDLWLQNLERIPVGWEIELSDLFPAMVQKAVRALGERQHPFGFLWIDAQAIPFATSQFDAVIANHMLYHAPDLAQALTEIQRVLRPGGCLYAATNGRAHMLELIEMVERFDPGLGYRRGFSEPAFLLESGPAHLSPFFSTVTCHRYGDGLVVTEVEALVDYVLSGLEGAEHRRDELRAFVQGELQRQGGSIRITKDSGILVAQ
jgi:ubiquinone/menaquinone biosynthesis C-methylase UbiE